jgi:hypothetical protein
MKEKEFGPATPRDAEWGAKYFHLPIQTATNCHLPNQSAKAARFVSIGRIVETRAPGNYLGFLEVEHKQI